MTALRMAVIESWPHTDTPRRTPSPFQATYEDSRNLLARELGHLGAREGTITLVAPAGSVRLDGQLRARTPVAHPGVLASATTRHGALTWATDQFTSASGRGGTHWHHNLRAIALGLEALRKVDRYGVSASGQQYAGFLALEAGTAARPAGGVTATEALARLAEIGGVSALGRTREQVVRLARAAAHPDRHGGDRAPWDEVVHLVAALGTCR